MNARNGPDPAAAAAQPESVIASPSTSRGGGDEHQLSLPFIPLAIGIGVVFPGLLTIFFAYVGYRRYVIFFGLPTHILLTYV